MSESDLQVLQTLPGVDLRAGRRGRYRIAVMGAMPATNGIITSVNNSSRGFTSDNSSR